MNPPAAAPVARCTILCVALTHLLPVLPAQDLPPQEIEFSIYTEPPRLFLNSRRLRLLQREKERDSLRWAQFQTLMEGQARFPEPGFAHALYGRVTGQESHCKMAAAWAGKEANPAQPEDLRQIALVLDWCAASLPEGERRQIAMRAKPQLNTAPTSIRVARSQTLTALALADEEAKLAEDALRRVAQWWSAQVAPRLRRDDDPFERREDLFAAIELLHVFRDNLRADLREGASRWFEDLPSRQLLRYYPQPWPAAENEFRIPAYEGAGEPDLREALFSRAAELAYVAFDTNAQPNQFLQGWLMQDRFLLRGTLGIPYELLWANPYLPGLSFHYMPNLYHANGELFVRGNWDEDANWFGFRKGQAQGFARGARVSVRPGTRPAPIDLGAARVFFAQSGLRFETGWLPPPAEGEPAGEEAAFLVGLEPSTAYDVEVDDEGMFEARSDSGGILDLRFIPGRTAGVRIKKTTPLVN